MIRIIQLNLILLVCLSSCNNNKSITEQTKETNLYFNYDEVEYFHINIDHSSLLEINKNKRFKSLSALLNERIKSINDSSFYNTLYTYPFSKKLIPSSVHEQLSEIFQQKKHSTVESFSCIPIYRDVLIFKKDGEVIGIAKICFECNQHSIVGTKHNTDNFGQSGDYEKLAQLLKSL